MNDELANNLAKLLYDNKVHDRCITELTEKIEELRKDKNWDVDCIQERLSNVASYHIKLINTLFEENKQLKETISNLNKVIDMIWTQIDRLERKGLND